MRVILIDDHGNVEIHELAAEGHDSPVMEAAKAHHFFPCPNCGMVCFEGTINPGGDDCLYCNPRD
jgi:hypothetical protein